MARWKKSSYSYNGNSCVEIKGPWRKSSLSYNGSSCMEVGILRCRKLVDWFVASAWHTSTASGYNGNCFEIRRAVGRFLDRHVKRSIQLRDTKDHGTGPVISCSRDGWEELLADLKAGKFDSL